MNALLLRPVNKIPAATEPSTAETTCSSPALSFCAPTTKHFPQKVVSITSPLHASESNPQAAEPVTELHRSQTGGLHQRYRTLRYGGYRCYRPTFFKRTSMCTRTHTNCTQWYLALMTSCVTENGLYVAYVRLSHACYMSCPSHPP
jgi:hypothetical protein